MNETDGILSVRDFDRRFTALFDRTRFETLATSSLPRVRLQMGSVSDPKQRRDQVVERCLRVARYVLDNGPFWTRMTVWGEGCHTALSELQRCGLGFSPDVLMKDAVDDSCVLVNHWKVFSENAVSASAFVIAGFDLGLDPHIDMKCYFVSFVHNVILNLYDDRGLDVVALSPSLIKNVEREFSWLVVD
jgi:hypothetical protein